MTIRLSRVLATAVVAPIKRSALRPQPTFVHLFPASVPMGGPMLCFVAMAASLSVPFVLWGMPGPGTVAVPGSQVKLARLDCREIDHGPDMTVCSGASKHPFIGMMWARSPSPRAEAIIGSSGGTPKWYFTLRLSGFRFPGNFYWPQRRTLGALSWPILSKYCINPLRALWTVVTNQNGKVWPEPGSFPVARSPKVPRSPWPHRWPT